MNNDLISSKFNEWTKDLTPIEARISVYEHIRDIPYAIIPSLRDYDKGPLGMLEENHGSCQPKHFLLYKYFQKLNIPVKLASYHFNWGTQPINYPDGIKKISHDLPMPYHLALKAFINGKWVLVDGSYDIPLKKGGFPVTEKWDGMSDTKNAVVPVKEIIHDSLEDRVTKDAANRDKFTDKQKAIYPEFIDKLNKWLEELRKV